jgi:hypothetical protein
VVMAGPFRLLPADRQPVQARTASVRPRLLSRCAAHPLPAAGVRSATVPAVTINSGDPVPASLDPATRAVLVKLLGRLIDVLGVDEARALTPTLVGYLAGPARGEGLLSAAQRARAVARHVLR